MPDFLLTATGPDGARETQKISARSSAEAISILESQGFNEVKLHTNEVAAVMGDYESDAVSYEERSRTDLMSHWQLVYFWWKKYVLKTWKTTLFILGVLLFLYFTDRNWVFMAIVMAGMLLLPVAMVFYVSFFGNARKYDLFLDAFAWGRWDEVLKRGPGLRGIVPDLEIDSHEAIAKSKLGRVEEGLAQIEQHSEDDEFPEWMYLSRLAEFYDYLDDKEAAANLHKEAYECDPANPVLELDYAGALLERKEQTSLAEKLIHSAEEKPGGDLLELVIPQFKARLHLAKQEFEQAIPLFLMGRSNLTSIAAGQPLFKLMVDINDARLAIAYQQTGDAKSAQKYYPRAKRRLEALGFQKLLNELENTVRV